MYNLRYCVAFLGTLLHFPVKAFETLTVCEGNTGTITCEGGIEIITARYGRTEWTVCEHKSIKTIDCLASGVEEKIRAICDGLTSCTLTPSNNDFGDPCSGTYKYLEVDYDCLPTENTTQAGMATTTLAMTTTKNYPTDISLHMPTISTTTTSTSQTTPSTSGSTISLPATFQNRISLSTIATSSIKSNPTRTGDITSSIVKSSCLTDFISSSETTSSVSGTIVSFQKETVVSLHVSSQNRIISSKIAPSTIDSISSSISTIGTISKSVAHTSDLTTDISSYEAMSSGFVSSQLQTYSPIQATFQNRITSSTIAMSAIDSTSPSISKTGTIVISTAKKSLVATDPSSGKTMSSGDFSKVETTNPQLATSQNRITLSTIGTSTTDSISSNVSTTGNIATSFAKTSSEIILTSSLSPVSLIRTTILIPVISRNRIISSTIDTSAIHFISPSSSTTGDFATSIAGTSFSIAVISSSESLSSGFASSQTELTSPLHTTQNRITSSIIGTPTTESISSTVSTTGSIATSFAKTSSEIISTALWPPVSPTRTTPIIPQTGTTISIPVTSQNEIISSTTDTAAIDITSSLRASAGNVATSVSKTSVSMADISSSEIMSLGITSSPAETTILLLPTSRNRNTSSIKGTASISSTVSTNKDIVTSEIASMSSKVHVSLMDTTVSIPGSSQNGIISSTIDTSAVNIASSLRSSTGNAATSISKISVSRADISSSEIMSLSFNASQADTTSPLYATSPNRITSSIKGLSTNEGFSSTVSTIGSFDTPFGKASSKNKSTPSRSTVSLIGTTISIPLSSQNGIISSTIETSAFDIISPPSSTPVNVATSIVRISFSIADIFSSENIASSGFASQRETTSALYAFSQKRITSSTIGTSTTDNISSTVSTTSNIATSFATTSSEIISMSSLSPVSLTETTISIPVTSQNRIISSTIDTSAIDFISPSRTTTGNVAISTGRVSFSLAYISSSENISLSFASSQTELTSPLYATSQNFIISSGVDTSAIRNISSAIPTAGNTTTSFVKTSVSTKTFSPSEATPWKYTFSRAEMTVPLLVTSQNRITSSTIAMSSVLTNAISPTVSESFSVMSSTPIVSYHDDGTCSCVCRYITEPSCQGDAIDCKVIALKREVAINKTSLSSHKRTKISVYDGRTSATLVGIVGVGFIVIFLLLIVASDMLRVIDFFNSNSNYIRYS